MESVRRIAKIDGAMPNVRLSPLQVPARSRLLLAVTLMVVGLATGCSGGEVPIATICDGSSGLRLSFRNIGGGQVLPGSQVLSENGFNFLLVDGTCHFWARPDQWSDVREGDLTVEQADRLSGALRLAQWSELQGEYVDDLCDGPTREYRFDGAKIAVYASCGGGKNSESVDSLLTASVLQLAMVYEAGAPVDGPVRLVLVAEAADQFWPMWWVENAARWTGSGDPRAIALTYSQASSYEPGSSVLVMPPEADTLRSSRRSFADKNGFQLTGGFLPVLGPMDEKYEAFVRDSISIEDAQGLLHLEVDCDAAARNERSEPEESKPCRGLVNSASKTDALCADRFLGREAYYARRYFRA